MSQQSQDVRYDEYRLLTKEQLAHETSQTLISARIILEILFDYVRPASVLDVGCGLGGFMKACQDMGITDVRGLEGPWMERDKLIVDPSHVEFCDLEKGFSLQRRFDLVICTEVAEHLAPESAERFVQSLTAHSDVILFSAAIPLQEGCHHVNEQFPDYWARLFAQQGFVPLDFIRWRVWDDTRVLWWLRQNTLLFIHQRVLPGNARLQHEREQTRSLNIVHPQVYGWGLKQASQAFEKQRASIQFLAQGGTFEIIPQPDGSLNIRKK